MKTVEQKLVSMCLVRGMLEDQAEDVVDLAKQELPEAGSVTWRSPSDEYPAGMYTRMFKTIKRVAIKWIDENEPKARFRSNFEQ